MYEQATIINFNELYSGHHQMIEKPVIGNQIAREAGLLAYVVNVT
jgi:hypothetical protein